MSERTYDTITHSIRASFSSCEAFPAQFFNPSRSPMINPVFRASSSKLTRSGHQANTSSARAPLRASSKPTATSTILGRSSPSQKTLAPQTPQKALVTVLELRYVFMLPQYFFRVKGSRSAASSVILTVGMKAQNVISNPEALRHVVQAHVPAR